MKASESAQALLHSQLENSKELLLKDEEFKSLQLQVREINLLRESNVRLREENKHNFEECQKLLEKAQKTKTEAEKLENLLTQKKLEVSALQKDVELLKVEISHLNNKNAEMLESNENINIKECEQMKDELEHIKDKQKVEDELHRHKSAITVVLERAGILASQLPSGSSLDERAVAYFHSVSSFEAATSSFINDVEGAQSSPANALTTDNSSAASGQQVLTQQKKLPRPNSKTIDEREKASTVGKSNVETRKPGRRFVLPSLEKSEGPIIDSEITGVEISNISEGKAISSNEHGSSSDFSLDLPIVARKRLAPSESEILEGCASHDEVNVDVPPPSKRTKESEFSEIPEAYDIHPSAENLDMVTQQDFPPSDTTEMQIPQTNKELDDKLPLVPHEEFVDLVKGDENNIPVNEESEEQQKDYLDIGNQDEVQYECDVVVEDFLEKPIASVESLEESPKNDEIKEILNSVAEGEEDREEGELMPDEAEQQTDDGVSEEGLHDSITGEVAGSGDEADDAVEIASPNNDQDALDSINKSMVTDDVENVAEDSEKRNSNSIDQGTFGSEPSPQISTGSREDPPTPFQQKLASGQQTPNTPVVDTGEYRATRSSRTISISETAKRNAQLRQAGMAPQQQQPPSSPPRGRRPPFRRDGGRGRGRGGRG